MYLSVNGIQLYYEEMGSGDPLILLHCNGADWHIFQDIIPRLAENYHVYALDSRGHGKSSKVKTLQFADMMQDVAEMIRVLQVEKPIVYGYSDGGIIGLLLAGVYPDMLRKLIVSGANLNPNGVKSWVLWLWKLSYLLTRRANLKMLLTQPQISASLLAQIRVPTVVLAGEKDIIKQAHTRGIADGIAHSTLRIIPHESHGSYVHDNRKLFDVLQPYLSD